MPTRAEMMAAVNATRPSSQSSSMTEEQLMSLLQHPDPKVRDAARRELDSRRQSGSSTADLVNETRPAPQVLTLPEPEPLVRPQTTAPQADSSSAAGTGVNGAVTLADVVAKYQDKPAYQRAVQSGQYTPPAGRSNSADLDSNDAAATPLSDEKWSDEKEVRYRVLKFGMTEEQARKSLAEEKAAATARADASDARIAKFDQELEPIYGDPKPDMSSTDVLPGDQPGTARRWNPATGRYDTVTVAKPSAPAPAPFYGRTVPGPVAVDGSPVAAPRAFASQEEADAYNTRPAKDGVPTTVGALEPSQRDIDMRARGYVPVYGRDGSVTYALEAPSAGDNPGVGGPGRRGLRPDLTQGSPSTKANNMGTPGHYEPTAASGPVGNHMVLRPTEEFKGTIKTAQEQRELNRLIETSGLPAQVILQAYADGDINAARMVANGAKAEAGARRREAVVRQAQFAQRPANLLDNPTASDWTRRMVSEALLRSGRPGATPLDVQGQQMQNMQNIAQQLAVGALQAGPAQAQLEAAERERRERREADARAAAAKAAPSINWGMEVPPGLRWQRAYDAAIGAGVDGATARRIADDVVGGASAPAGDGREDGRAVPPAGREPPA